MSWFSVTPVELDALRLSLWVALVAVALHYKVTEIVLECVGRNVFTCQGVQASQCLDDS